MTAHNQDDYPSDNSQELNDSENLGKPESATVQQSKRLLPDFVDSAEVFQPDFVPEHLPLNEPHKLVDAVNRVMPFGKYQGRRLMEIPEFYFVWFKQRGFPNGKLGQEMALVYEIKLNRLENLVKPLMKMDAKDV